MTTTTATKSLWKKILKVVVIIVTAISSGTSIAGPDFTPDDTAQLSLSGSKVEVKAASRRTVARAAKTRGEYRDLSPLYGDDRGSKAPVEEDAMLRYHADTFRTAHTAFGAGSFAASALGKNAST